VGCGKKCCVRVFVEMAMKTSGAGGSRQQRQQQRQQQRPRRTQRDKNQHNDYDDGDDDDDVDDNDNDDDSATSPRCLSRDDVLAALGYRSLGNVSSASPQQQQQQAQRSSSSACRRCAKRVYPLELVDVGDCYHRGCFKCYVSVRAGFISFTDTKTLYLLIMI